MIWINKISKNVYKYFGKTKRIPQLKNKETENWTILTNMETDLKRVYTDEQIKDNFYMYTDEQFEDMKGA